MTTPVLYDYWRSSASYRVRIALNLKDIAYQAVSIDLQTQQHGGAEHRARNPQGFVPALDIDGSMMTQSLAIIEYLDSRNPAPALLPADPAEAARLRAIAYAIAMEIHPICNPSVVAHHAAAFDGSDDDRKIWMQHFIDKGLRAVEVLANHPTSGRFLHGDSPGLADIVLVPQLYNARRWDVPLDDMPRLTAIDAACRDLPAFAAAAPEAVNSAPS
ncbi:MAG: maleylacetoacetate isomerase [Alphaproteobacteria bacterium]|nr:maleylacetoacetate isomerase [Alphaproteobacteria bacterium]